MTKLLEITIQDAKEDIIEEKCGSCKMFKSARTFEKNLKRYQRWNQPNTNKVE